MLDFGQSQRLPFLFFLRCRANEDNGDLSNSSPAIQTRRPLEIPPPVAGAKLPAPLCPTEYQACDHVIRPGQVGAKYCPVT
jgi:hypothetical protein